MWLAGIDYFILVIPIILLLYMCFLAAASLLFVNFLNVFRSLIYYVTCHCKTFYLLFYQKAIILGRSTLFQMNN